MIPEHVFSQGKPVLRPKGTCLKYRDHKTSLSVADLPILSARGGCVF